MGMAQGLGQQDLAYRQAIQDAQHKQIEWLRLNQLID